MLWLVLLFLVALPAAGTGEVEPGHDGGELYRRDCASCHGPRGEGSRRGPPLQEAGEAHNVYYLHTGRMPILSPDEPIRAKPVPYTDEQLGELVSYASALGDGPALPRLEMEETDLSSGGVDYRLHCAICHGATGEGGALVGGDHAPSLMAASPTVMMAAMMAGPGPMPSFEPVLVQEQMADITSYVAHLQEPTGVAKAVPGGRVGEGLVGLAAALALVAAARLIGDRQ